MAEIMLLVLAVLFLCGVIRQGEPGPVGRPSKGNLLSSSMTSMKSNPETLEELTSKDRALVEGDVLLSSNRNAVTNIWPSHKIAYVISPELAYRTSDLQSAMQMLSETDCLSFHERTSEQDYLYFEASDGCASYVGFYGGQQSIYVGSVCGVGNVVHEILHALGLHHEHTRSDREKHIVILYQNIMAGREKNFDKHEGETFHIPYDLQSIMHYGSNFFSSNGKETISPIKQGVEGMGQRDNLSPLDIRRIRRLYNCV